MELRDFIKNHSSLIDSRDYEKLYKTALLQLSRTDIGTLTNLFQHIGQNPLNSMTSIPNNFFFGITSGTLDIPNSIIRIQNNAFAGSRFAHVKIPKSIKEFEFLSFYNCSIDYVEYMGFIEDFKKIINYKSIGSAGIRKIECIDGFTAIY